MDIFLLIMTIIIGVLLIFANLYILAIYCHPEDSGFGANLLCKIIIVGLTLCWGQVLLIPLDTSNSRGYGAGFNMEIVWIIVFIAVLAFLVVLIPLASFYYESDEEKSIRICTTIAMEIVMVLLAGVYFAMFYLFCTTVYLPVKVLSFDLKADSMPSNMIDSDILVTPEYLATQIQISQSLKAEFTVSIQVSIIASLCLLGSFILVLFAGMGLSALPIDLIRSFRARPTFTSSKQAFTKKSTLREQCQNLIELGEKIQENQLEVKYQKGFWARRKVKSKYSTDFQVFSESVLMLEDEHSLFKMELEISTVNPIIFYGKLLLGFLGIIVSLFWWAHLLFAVVIKKNGFPFYPLIDKALLKMEQLGIDFIGIAIFTFFSLYLLWCGMKGNLKIGLAIPFLFTIHPMRPNETWMNSFLFNLNLMLLMAVAVVQLVSKCFIQYIRFSDLSHIFNFQIYYMEFYQLFYQHDVFEIGILAWGGLSMIYFIAKSQTKPQLIKDIEIQKKKMKKYKKNQDVELQELLIKKKIDDNSKQEETQKEEKIARQNKQKQSSSNKNQDKQEGEQNLQESIYDLFGTDSKVDKQKSNKKKNK